MGRYNEMAQRNRGMWERHRFPVVTLSPTDEPMQVPGLVNIPLGLEGYTGHMSLVRWRLMLEWCAEQPFDWFLMHETDSVCLQNDLPCYLFDKNTFFSNEMPENANPPIQGFYCIAPWFFSRDLIKRMVHFIPDLKFTGPPNGDRWLGQLLEQGGFKHAPFQNGIGCGTLSTAPGPFARITPGGKRRPRWSPFHSRRENSRRPDSLIPMLKHLLTFSWWYIRFFLVSSACVLAKFAGGVAGLTWHVLMYPRALISYAKFVKTLKK